LENTKDKAALSTALRVNSHRNGVSDKEDCHVAALLAMTAQIQIRLEAEVLS
jgi:hypothetical protein